MGLGDRQEAWMMDDVTLEVLKQNAIDFGSCAIMHGLFPCSKVSNWHGDDDSGRLAFVGVLMIFRDC
jgi:hypothetical protein